MSSPTSLNRLAASATAHCLTSCAIGEVLGVVIGTALSWSTLWTIVLAIVLAFVFGYTLTLRPLLRSGFALSAAIPVALAAVNRYLLARGRGHSVVHRFHEAGGH